MIGSKKRFIGSNAPIRTPSGSAVAAARRKAMPMRRVEVHTASSRSCSKMSMPLRSSEYGITSSPLRSVGISWSFSASRIGVRPCPTAYPIS